MKEKLANGSLLLWETENLECMNFKKLLLILKISISISKSDNKTQYLN